MWKYKPQQFERVSLPGMPKKQLELSKMSVKADADRLSDMLGQNKLEDLAFNNNSSSTAADEDPV
jgi:hypothetical protein